MSKHASAAHYARALFESVVSSADPVAIGEELDAAVALLDAHPELGRVLRDPVLEAAKKRNVIGEVARTAGWSPAMTQALDILASAHELHTLPSMASHYRKLLRQQQQVLDATVTTAVPLDEAQSRAIVETLARQAGQRVQVSFGVDPSIVGGVVTRMGSTIYDGSVARQLERMREQIVGRV